jgi:hypothetical protein
MILCVWPPEGWPRVELYRSYFLDLFEFPITVFVFGIGGN